MTGLVGDDAAKIESTAGNGITHGERHLLRIELHVGVVDFARAGVERDRRQTERVARVVVRPHDVAKHDHVLVGPFAVVLHHVALDGAFVDGVDARLPALVTRSVAPGGERVGHHLLGLVERDLGAGVPLQAVPDARRPPPERLRVVRPHETSVRLGVEVGRRRFGQRPAERRGVSSAKKQKDEDDQRAPSSNHSNRPFRDAKSEERAERSRPDGCSTECLNAWRARHRTSSPTKPSVASSSRPVAAGATEREVGAGRRPPHAPKKYC